MSDIFDELTRDVKDEKVQTAFAEFLHITARVVAFLVVVMLAKNWIDVRKLHHNMLMGDTLHKALLLEQNNQISLANESFDYFLQEVKWDSQKELVKLHKAKKILDTGDLDKGQDALYDIFSALYHTDLTKSYARLLWCIIELDRSESKYKQDQLERNFAYIATKGGVFYGNGSVVYSLWLMKNNREDEAKKVLEELVKSENIPSSVMTFAAAILSNLSS